PVLVYGIVTNVENWVFLRWAGSSEDPTVEIFDSVSYDLNYNDITRAKKVVEYIVFILQSQARALKDSSN
ncbi:2355_t:CDS:1, partial [Dentiscutata erythropus]